MAARAQWTGMIMFGNTFFVNGRLFSAESEKPEELQRIPVHLKCNRRLDLPLAVAPKTKATVERPDAKKTVTKRVGKTKEGFTCQSCGIAVPKDELGYGYLGQNEKLVLLSKGELELLDSKPCDKLYAEFISENDPLLDTFGTDRRMLFVPNADDEHSVKDYWQIFQALREQEKLAYLREIVIVRNPYSAIIRPVTLDIRITQDFETDILMLECLRDPRLIKNPHDVTTIATRPRINPESIPELPIRELDLDSILTPRIELIRRLLKAKEKA